MVNVKTTTFLSLILKQVEEILLITPDNYTH